MICNILKRNMTQNIKVINNAETAEKRLMELRYKLEDIKKVKLDTKIKELTEENKSLVTNIENAKATLIRLEILNGKKQYELPGKTTTSLCTIKSKDSENIEVENQKLLEKKESAKKTKPKVSEIVSESPVDIRKLDFRIGKIVEINKHPDANSLYVEKIDCGEDKPRTIVSGLVNHVSIQEMESRIVMVLCNLKPVKMRGVTSEGMVMCASTLDKVEVLVPPVEALPGDLVWCKGYPREPEAQLNPKKKIFETCAPDLLTNDKCVACYKGSPLVVPGKGPVMAPTLKNVSVK